MRHQRALRKLGRTTEHRVALLRNLSTALFQHERITTTLIKAKEVRPFAEKLITLARRDSLHSRRLAGRDIQDRKVLKKLFDTLGPRFSQRPGGYSRILKLGWRHGDAAEVAILELIGSEPNFDKGKKGKKAKKKKEAKEAAGGEEAAAETEKPGKKKAKADKGHEHAHDHAHDHEHDAHAHEATAAKAKTKRTSGPARTGGGKKPAQ
jgi:large subunit ribosomal protein L17